MPSLLKEVDPEKYFLVADGRTLKNLKELANALQEMDETTFRRHVNQHKNDFHSWVRDVHEDHKLAGALLKVKRKDHAFSAVTQRIQEMHKKISPLQISPLPIGHLTSASWYKQPTLWVTIFGALLTVALVSTTSHAVVTGAVVGDALGRSSHLLGGIVLCAGIFLLVKGKRKKSRKKKRL